MFDTALSCKSPSILIAEDESRLATMLAKGLHKNGYETAIARNGEQAIQMAQTGCFGLLLLDLGLPIKNGWTVLAELRQRQDSLPVIILTAFGDETDLRVGLQKGANDYVMKPFHFADLLTRIRANFDE
ncbi:MAG: response regulator [Pseudanabaenales cyanobacterium]|nr:response regulator [Pseudanabaenales cyanobacterium]